MRDLSYARAFSLADGNTSLQPLEQLREAGGAKGAGPGAENATVTQPNSHWSNSEQQGALRARGRRARSRNAPLAQPTAIGTTEGSWGRQGRGAQGQEQKMRPLRSLQPLEQLRAAGGAKGAGRRARNRKCDPCAAYGHWNNSAQQRARAQGQEQKMRPPDQEINRNLTEI